ncbi:MAG: T9SS C-terminal target domain-containing protein, partial [Bacteroidetes bacterium]
HVDHHKIHFDEEVDGNIYFGNDGGVYWKSGTASPKDRNFGYNITQFYGGAIHPEAGKNYYLAGSQDNNSLQMQGPTSPSEGVVVRGGDGMLCHIDQEDGKYQIVSSQNGNWSLSTNYGDTFSGGLGANGRWVCASDIDKETKIAYIQTGSGDLYRWRLSSGDEELIDVDGFNLSGGGDVATIFVDDNVSNRVYLGTYNGIVLRLDGANEGDVVASENIGSFTGSVSSVDVEYGNPDHILVTLSNYGVTSVYETTNGGDNWTAVGGNIPDMPVRWGIFSPVDPTQALLATEVGVWATELLDGSNTTWYPSQSDKGIPLTRVDQLRVRRSDNMVLAATYGRGLFTTDIFMDPVADMFIDRIGYLNAPLRFLGEQAINASSWAWDLGDGTTSSVENLTHSYGNIGTYPVSLTINDDLTKESDVKILPDRGLPYIPGTGNYGGDFESNTEQYGVFTVSGSSFSRGNSEIEGKNGVKSGANAFVLGIDEPYYQNGTHSMLYLPNFNMEDDGIYEFSFWSKFSLNNGYDGFRVEYSTDRGQSWEQLGSDDDENWYNFKNNNLEGAGWPQGASYFSGQRSSYKNFKLNISSLAGNKDVAFRFVFKASNSGNFRGLAIDDVEISKFEGELLTKLLSFSGEFTDPTEITLSWLTQPEYFCQRFEVERSYNGFDFEEIETIYAEGGTSSEMHSYDMVTLGQRQLQFFRLKVISENAAEDYNYEFYSPTIVMRRKLEGTEVSLVFPNPIEDQIFLTFTDILDGEASYELFAANGQLVLKGVIAEGSPTGIIDVPASLAPGVYVLSVETATGNEQSFKLLKN